MIVTTLEMRSQPHLHLTPPLRPAMLVPMTEPSVRFYRYLHDGVGSDWGWTPVAATPDDELAHHLEDAVIGVLSVGGVPAGFYELARRSPEEVEVVHVGLLPEFRGRGLGKHILAGAVEAAWSMEPERVVVSTDDREHPRGLLLYQWAGFVPVETHREGDQSS